MSVAGVSMLCLVTGCNLNNFGVSRLRTFDINFMLIPNKPKLPIVSHTNFGYIIKQPSAKIEADQVFEGQPMVVP